MKKKSLLAALLLSALLVPAGAFAAAPETPEATAVTETYTVKVTRSADGENGTWEIVK